MSLNCQTPAISPVVELENIQHHLKLTFEIDKMDTPVTRGEIETIKSDVNEMKREVNEIKEMLKYIHSQNQAPHRPVHTSSPFLEAEESFVSGAAEQVSDDPRPRRRRSGLKEKLRQRMAQYREGFTVHGLNWLCTGSLPEKVVWATFISLVMGFAIYMVNGYVQKYLRYEWRTEIRYVETQTILQPVVVFCSSSLKTVWRCYKNIDFQTNRSCSIHTRKYQRLEYINYTAEKYVSGKSFGRICSSINADKSIKLGDTEFLITSFMSYSSGSRDNLMIFLYGHDEFHGKRANFPHFFESYTILQPGNYELQISNTQIERLPYPYSPNCSTRPNTLTSSFTHSSCLQLCQWNRMYQKCGDVPDFAQLYFKKTLQNDSITNYHTIRGCLYRVWKSYDESKCDCPFACSGAKYKTRIKAGIVEDGNNSKLWTTWTVKILNEDSHVTQITQVASYTLEDALGAVGGILGLTVGASSLSFLEVTVYCVLFIASMVC